VESSNKDVDDDLNKVQAEALALVAAMAMTKLRTGELQTQEQTSRQSDACGLWMPG